MHIQIDTNTRMYIYIYNHTHICRQHTKMCTSVLVACVFDQTNIYDFVVNMSCINGRSTFQNPKLNHH